MKIFVMGLCGLLLAALPAAAGDRWGDYDREVDKTDVDGSDLDTGGMDTDLNSAGLSEGNDFSGMDTQMDWSDTNPDQDTNDLDVPPTPELPNSPYTGKVPADAIPGDSVPADISTADKWPAADLPPEPNYLPE